MNKLSKIIRINFPQWQGGDNPAYYIGAKLLDWLAPKTKTPVFEISVPQPDHSLCVENGMTGRTELKAQIKQTWQIIHSQTPEKIITFGGDCLVSLAPFAWLNEIYGDQLGILWIDSHPDVQTPAQYQNAHAHALAALMGMGDPDLTQTVRHPISAAQIMIAGIHHPLEYEAQFLSQHHIATCSPEEVKNGASSVFDWIKNNNLKYLAIHLDLDVLDPVLFRSVLFARPERQPDDFNYVAEGQLKISDVLHLIHETTTLSETVGLTIAEHIPWDVINLKSMLAQLPLIND